MEEYLELIKRVFPVNIADATVHDNGDDFLVLEVNGEWMFRFPRREISRKAFAVERAFLARFKSISPLPIPDYQTGDSNLGWYRKISGELLTAELFHSLPSQTRAQIARQMGEFLSAVHRFPVEEAKRLGLTEGWDGWQSRGVQHFREEIAPQLSPAARKSAMTLVESMMSEPFELTVIHGDFALEDHVFFDEKIQGLCGVIDFADVTLNDPAHDFQNILEYGGEEFFEAVTRHYAGASDPALLQRTRLRIEARPMFEAAYSSLFGFEERFKERIKYIEERYG